MSEVWSLMGEKFVQDALKAALLVALVCSFLGVYVVLKRIVFVGAALAEVASLGAALALSAPAVAAFDWLVARAAWMEPLQHFKPLVFALVLMLAAVAFFSQQTLSRRLPREAVIGATFAGAIGLTLLLLSKVGAQGQHEMDVLTGNILGVAPEELIELTVAAIGVGAIQALFFKEFVLVSFDPEVARTLGFRSSRWELLWYVSLGVMIAVSIHVAGTVLVFAYLVLPAVGALRLSRRLGFVFLLAVLLGVGCTLLGVLLSVSPQVDTPTSPTIVGCLAGAAVLCWAIGALLQRRPARTK
ncbi:MAG: metal ABC transporter permease [Armatimonadota bacterium]